MKKGTFYFFLFCLYSAISQVQYHGRVVDDATGNPIENVLIEHAETNAWVTTNSSGYFDIVIPQTKKILLDIKHLAYVNKQIILDSDPNVVIEIRLEENDLRIDEVVLIGTNKKHSEIVLKSEAVDNVQSFSALGVLEQLPGQSTSETALNGYKNIVFRTAEVGLTGGESYANKAFGTAIVVNDIPLSNNENLQKWAPNSAGVFGTTLNQFTVEDDPSSINRFTPYNNPGLGVDLRQIPTENIDEIEVVQGIPEARYGDLTSGLVKIKTKAGVTPFISSISFRDGTTQVNASKGFKISDTWGVLNIGGSYLNSKEDPKEVLDVYNRVNLNADWSIFKEKTKNTLSLVLASSLDDGQQDPNDIEETFVKNKDQSIILSNRFSYRLDNWIEEISVNASFNYKQQHTIRRNKVNTGGEVIPVALESGISQGLYTPAVYFSTREIDGKPINGFFDLQLLKNFSTTKQWSHKVIAGTTLRYSDNLGEGRIGNPETADVQLVLSDFNSATTGFRPYSFNDNLRPELQIAGFVQDNILKYWDNSSFSIAAGMRWDNQNSYNTISPRLNTYFQKHKVKVRGGIGLSSKAPSLNSLYTGKQYFDQIIGDFRTSDYNVAYVQTFVKEEQNLDLKPTRSLNTELGLDYQLGWADLSITGFYKKLTDGLTTLRVFNTVLGDDYEVVFNEPEAPTIDIIGERLYTYEDSRTINGLTSVDYGVEFSLRIPKIKGLNLNGNINGLFAKTENNNISDIYTDSSVASENAAIGVFDESITTIQELFRIGSSINYHISKVGLLVNLRTEHFIINDTYVNDDYEIYPVGYYDQENAYFDIPEVDRTNEELYGHLFRTINTVNTNTSDKVFHNLHLRISKDFTNGFRIDFYANNFLNLQPTYIDINGDEILVRERDITPLSFGMKLNYKL